MNQNNTKQDTDIDTTSNIKHIYFVRHGESEANVAQMPGESDSPLTEKGRQQAQLVAERFNTIPIEVIIASPFLRTQQTADYIQKQTQKPVVESDLFIERRYPSEVMELSPDDPLRIEVNEHERANLLSGSEKRYSDEESFGDLKERADKAIAFLMNREEEHIVVVSHGLFLKTLVFYMLLGENLTPPVYHDILHNFSIWNTGITYVRKKELSEGFRIFQWNDSAHLGEIK